MFYLLFYILILSLFQITQSFSDNKSMNIINRDINFISYGDWGYKGIHQSAVAEQIYNFTNKYDSKFNYR